jgi:site-specific DNA-cytosine methylase
MKVLIACEFSGIVREAFRARGHDAWSCDLLPTDIPGQHIQDDVLNHLDGWDLIIGHPPCDNLAVSGARWFPEKRADGRQDASARFFMTVAGAACDRVALENPVGIMSRLFRKPDQIIQPWQFGHGETKATCLWLKNLPKLIPTNIVSGREPRCHHASPRPDRWKIRSRTYQGIADAMAKQWG